MDLETHIKQFKIQENNKMREYSKTKPQLRKPKSQHLTNTNREIKQNQHENLTRNKNYSNTKFKLP